VRARLHRAGTVRGVWTMTAIDATGKAGR
jgi:hypothetical protein